MTLQRYIFFMVYTKKLTFYYNEDAPEPPKGDKLEKVIEYRVINGVFRGTLKISERRMTRDE